MTTTVPKNQRPTVCFACLSSNQTGVKYFRFPESENMRDKWFAILGIMPLTVFSDEMGICSQHFSVHDFHRVNGKIELIAGALPKALKGGSSLVGSKLISEEEIKIEREIIKRIRAHADHLKRVRRKQEKRILRSKLIVTKYENYFKMLQSKYYVTDDVLRKLRRIVPKATKPQVEVKTEGAILSAEMGDFLQRRLVDLEGKVQAKRKKIAAIKKLLLAKDKEIFDLKKQGISLLNNTQVPY